MQENSESETERELIRPSDLKRKSTSLAALLVDKPPKIPYNPLFLNKVEVTKHKFSVDLPCHKGSVIAYAKQSERKETLDAVWAQRHTWLKTNLKFSNIRGMKKKMFDIALDKGLEISSVAYAYVFFEKLILKNMVTKDNYKILAAACLLLAVKFDAPLVFTELTNLHKDILQEFHEGFAISVKDLLQTEFHVFRALRFSLNVKNREILPHLRILQETPKYKDIFYTKVKTNEPVVQDLDTEPRLLTQSWIELSPN